MRSTHNTTRFAHAAAVTAFVLALGVLAPNAAAHEVAGPPAPPAVAPDAPQEPAKPAVARPDSVKTEAAPASESKPLIGAGVGAGGVRSPLQAPIVEPESSLRTFASMAAPLAIVIGVILVSALLLRKVLSVSPGLSAALGAGGPSPSGLLEVIGRYPVARGQSLVLLKLDQRVLLLSHAHGGWRKASAAGGFTTLCEINTPSEVASILLKARDNESESIDRRFRGLMDRFSTESRTLDDDEPQIGRETRANPDGDRSELWDDQATVPAQPPVVPFRKAAGVQRDPARASGRDPVASLRERLAAFKGVEGGAS